MNKKCPFCASDKIKVESKNSTKGLRIKERSAGYRSRFTGSVRCNRCFSRGPTISVLCTGDSPSTAEKEMLVEMAYAVWNNRNF